MKNKQIYQSKEALIAIACLGALLLISPFCNKHNKKTVLKQPQTTGTVIKHHSYTGDDYYPMTQLWLDTDGNKETAEAVCEFAADDITPLTAEDLEQIMPVGTTRTIWEWNRLGRLSKFEQR